MYHDVIIAGFGGQGVMLIGNLLAEAGMEAGLNVTFIPVYGAEMRGGTANCTVVLSDEPVGSPIVARPYSLIAMNGPSLDKFQPCLREEGVQIVNSSLIDPGQVDPRRCSVLVPVNHIADEQIGSSKLANMVALGAFIKAASCLELETVIRALPSSIPERYHHLLPQNAAALKAGFDYAS